MGSPKQAETGGQGHAPSSEASAPRASAWSARLPRSARHAGAVAIAIGALAVAGWTIGSPRLTALRPGWPVMHPTTALLAMLAGISLVLVASASAPLGARLAGGLCAAATSTAAGLILVELATGVSLGIGDLVRDLAEMAGAAGARSLGTTAPSSAAALLLTGVALLALTDASQRRARVAQYLALASGSIAAFALLGYMFGVPAFYRPPALGPHAGMAVHTAVTLLVLAGGLLAARPREGLVSIVTADHAGGVMARRLLPSMVAFVPVALLVLLGQRRGWYDEAVVLAVLAYLALVESSIFVLLTAHRLNEDDVARIAASRRAREHRAWLRATIDQMPEGVLLLDKQGRMAALNRVATTLSCGDTGRLDPFGNPVAFDVRMPDGLPVVFESLPLVRALKQGEVSQGQELLLRTADGRMVPVLASSAPVRDEHGRITGATVVIQDITTLKELERLREEWTSVVAHDLRQPVGTIALTAQMLVKMYGGEMPDKERRGLERIKATSDRLNRMINDLLDLSLIEAKRVSLDRRPVDVVGLIDAVLDGLHDALAGHQVGVVAAQGLVAWVDPDRIHQVLANLISNAAKHGRPGTGIRVHLAGDAEVIEVTVSNWGVGIPPDELQTIFNRFQRSRDARAERVPGLGLGLYIAKGFVEAHGGRIWAESVPGEWTSFHFTVPRAAPAPEHREAGGEAHPPG